MIRLLGDGGLVYYVTKEFYLKVNREDTKRRVYFGTMRI